MRWCCCLTAAALLAAAGTAGAQGSGASRCVLLCAPSLTFNVAEIRSHVLGSPSVRNDTTGKVSELPSRTNLELQVVAVIKTTLPRVSGLVSVQWLPTARTSANPFTEYTATQTGEDEVHANMPSVSLGALVNALPAKSTAGWISADVYGVDLLSPAARPGDASAYTWKFDVGGVVSVFPFVDLPADNALHRSGAHLFAQLDYVATGLPHAGDDVPRGVHTFVTGAKPAALIAGLGIPFAPFLNAQ